MMGAGKSEESVDIELAHQSSGQELCLSSTAKKADQIDQFRVSKDSFSWEPNSAAMCSVFPGRRWADLVSDFGSSKDRADVQYIIQRAQISVNEGNKPDHNSAITIRSDRCDSDILVEKERDDAFAVTLQD